MGNNRPVVALSETSLISYLRVSPGKGKPRFGAEVQRIAVARFIDAQGLKLAAEYVEACKGGASLKHRTILTAALADAKARHCSIVVAKLDRLSHDAAFITYLMGRGVPVVVAELGDTKPFTMQPHPAPGKSTASTTADDAATIPARMLAMRADGMTLRAIAESLNAQGLRAPAGGLWQAGHVHRALSKLAARPGAKSEGEGG